MRGEPEYAVRWKFKFRVDSKLLLKVTTVRSMVKSIITGTNIDPVLLKQSKPAFNNYVQKSFIQ
jgi:hypothetical protein